MICLVLAGVPRRAGAQPAAVDQFRRARSLEAAGDYSGAGGIYFSYLKNVCVESPQSKSFPVGFCAAVGRRAVACLTIKEGRDIQRDPGVLSRPSSYLLQTYELMQQLEPNNPTWPYLRSLFKCVSGEYVEAAQQLRLSLRTTGGQASVRKKAAILLKHIQPYADRDQAQLTAQDSAALKSMLSGQFSANFGPAPVSGQTDSGTPSSSVSDSERRARAAENAGDSGAAARFRSGGTSVEDSSRYW